MDDSLYTLAQRLGERLSQRQLLLTAAESCTGGWLAKVVTDVPGSSSWFERGFVTYSNLSKQEMLGVSEETLSRSGAVSAETVQEMASGALSHSHAQVAVAISGIAGPGGGSEDKPVGTVYLCWAGGEEPRVERHVFAGDREQVRRQAVETVLLGLFEYLGDG